ncbi:MAG: metallophosphoesterase family protein [Acidimicrobiia bacterium]
MSAFVIAQISDLHVGSIYFDHELLTAAVNEIQELGPDLVVVAGDLTEEGYAAQFQIAREALRPLQEEFTTVVIPGNHDARNVGYVHFADSFGKGEAGAKLDRSVHMSRSRSPGMISVVAVDSSKPDLNEGEVGRERYEWIAEELSYPADYRIFVLHHHLVPVPGTGRERNIVWDAGDVLALLDNAQVNLVLAGHKHVPHVWVMGDMLIVNSGTASSFRLRGYTRPSYNVLHITEEEVTVTLVYPGVGERRAAHFDRLSRVLDRHPELDGMFSRATWTW